jgi:putative ABC transport system permease protein
LADFILTGFGEWSVQGNRLAVDQWKADAVVLSKEANSNLNVSVVDEKIEDSISGAKEIQPIGQQSLSIRPAEDEKAELTNVSLFGIEKDGFIMRKSQKAKLFQIKTKLLLQKH